MTAAAGADPDGPEVALLFWPSEAQRRDRLALDGLPRLLLLATGTTPPGSSDPLEDWVREPFEGTELDARVNRLRKRARLDRRRPRLGTDGVLHAGGLRVVLSRRQAPLLRLLVDHYAYVVPTSALEEAHAADGGARSGAAQVLRRSRRRLATVGLELHRIRGVGYRLCAPTDP